MVGVNSGLSVYYLTFGERHKVEVIVFIDGNKNVILLLAYFGMYVKVKNVVGVVLMRHQEED